jgi:hypothetical protein
MCRFSVGLFKNLLLMMLSIQVRKCYDMMEDYYSPRSAASDLLSTLCKVRRPILHCRVLFFSSQPAYVAYFFFAN